MTIYYAKLCIINTHYSRQPYPISCDLFPLTHETTPVHTPATEKEALTNPVFVEAMTGIANSPLKVPTAGSNRRPSSSRPARLAGNEYCRLGEVFELDRPLLREVK